MQAITLMAPWAWAVAHAGKDVENRKTRCPSILGQRIAIHAGVAPPPLRRRPAKTEALARAYHARRYAHADALLWMQARGLIADLPDALDYGCIVAVATIVGWAEGRSVVSHPNYEAEAVCHDGAESRWFMGPVGWLLHDVRTLPTPIPARGRQGIWTLPPESEAAVMAQLTETKGEIG